MTVRNNPTRRALTFALAIAAIFVIAAIGSIVALDLHPARSGEASSARPPANLVFFSVSLA